MSSTPSTSFSLAGKIVLLTGGAGLFGRGLATQLADAGATLVLASRDVTALQKVATEENARGVNVHARPLDQADEASRTIKTRGCIRSGT